MQHKTKIQTLLEEVISPLIFLNPTIIGVENYKRLRIGIQILLLDKNRFQNFILDKKNIISDNFHSKTLSIALKTVVKIS